MEVLNAKPAATTQFFGVEVCYSQQSSTLQRPNSSDRSTPPSLVDVLYPDSMAPGSDPMGDPTSFPARRPNASHLPSFELPPPSLTSLQHEHNAHSHGAVQSFTPNGSGMWPPPSNFKSTPYGFRPGHTQQSNGMTPTFNSGHIVPPTRLHMRNPAQILAKDRAFRCDQCPKSYDRNRDLKRHRRRHLAVPFPCGHCDKIFMRKDLLERHVLVKGCGQAYASMEVKGLGGSMSPDARSESMGKGVLVSCAAETRMGHNPVPLPCRPSGSSSPPYGSTSQRPLIGPEPLNEEQGRACQQQASQSQQDKVSGFDKRREDPIEAPDAQIGAHECNDTSFGYLKNATQTDRASASRSISNSVLVDPDITNRAQASHHASPRLIERSTATATNEVVETQKNTLPNNADEEDLLRTVQELRGRARELLFQTRLGEVDSIRRGRSSTASTQSGSSPDTHCRGRGRRSRSLPVIRVSSRRTAIGYTEVPSGSSHSSGAGSGSIPPSQHGFSSGFSNSAPIWQSTYGPDFDQNGDPGPALKRRRTSTCPEKLKATLECIYFRGEPDLYSDHVEKYEYIAQLLRHLRKHNFHACQYCFRKFQSNAAVKDHSCVKACLNISCRRKVATIADRPLSCVCVTTADDQWQHLYHLQYPRTGDLSTASGIAFQDTTFGAVSEFTPNNISTIEPWQPQMAWEDTSASEGAENAAPPAALSSHAFSLAAEIQMLRQQIQILEQRVLSQPTMREEDLEMTLANVWEGLCRSGSREARPEGSLWRLVRRHAPSVLSTATLSEPQSLGPQPGVNMEHGVLDNLDWGQISTVQGLGSLSKAPAVDSAYGTVGVR